MNSLVVICTLERCNVDGSKKMSLSKCVLNDGSPCYYLKEKEMEQTPSDDAWTKFNSFVKGKDK